VLYPKERGLWIMGTHCGARGTLDVFKAAEGGCMAHDGDAPKILGSDIQVMLTGKDGFTNYGR
jgi:hypothetical protein